MKSRKSEKNRVKMLFAAHVFVYTSRDGMVISNIVNISTGTLYRWSQQDKWIEALKFWCYEGNPEIQGELYRSEIKEYKVFRSLKSAFRLWKQMFGISKPTETLQRFLKD